MSNYVEYILKNTYVSKTRYIETLNNFTFITLLFLCNISNKIKTSKNRKRLKIVDAKFS